VCIYIYLYVRLRVAAFRIRSVRSGFVAGDPDPIRICTRYGPDTQAIQRTIHRMIRRSVVVRAVKTRRRFGSEIMSFHVSACSYVFIIVGMHLHVTLIISYDFLLYFTNLITCITS